MPSTIEATHDELDELGHLYSLSSFSSVTTRMDNHRRRPLLAVAFTFALLLFLSRLKSVFWSSEFQWPTFLGGFQVGPDFSFYKSLDTLSVEEFPFNLSDHRRTLIIGDIHGMNHSLQTLLMTLNYNPRTDSLIHVGDIVAKGPFEGSMAVLSYMASNNITGVRGNHDQKVIEWRGWIDWVHKFPEGKLWLLDLERQWDDADLNEEDLDGWTSQQKKRNNSRWWKTIPKGWKLFSDHYRIARAMSSSEYKYLLSLPLKLHIPHAHAFIIHAGLLPSDPRYKSSDRRQPLAHVPTVVRSDLSKRGSNIEKLRQMQELSLLYDIKQNADPWVNLNMRGLLKSHQITRGKDGKPWSKVWNRVMSRCEGFNLEGLSTSAKKLPCYPSTVVYGHIASRGLEVKRWSIGLDSGCVYGRELTALVLGSSQVESMDDARPRNDVVPFSDDSKGRIVSISCG